MHVEQTLRLGRLIDPLNQRNLFHRHYALPDKGLDGNVKISGIGIVAHPLTGRRALVPYWIGAMETVSRCLGNDFRLAEDRLDLSMEGL